MKQAMSTSMIFKIVLIFTFLFIAFLTLAITYNRAYRLKNSTLNIFEKYEGLGKKTLSITNSYLRNSGYKTIGQCEVGELGITSLDDVQYEKVTNNKDKKYYYCVSDRVVKNNNMENVYYNIRLFFKFNLPFFEELLTYSITGETKAIRVYDKDRQLIEGAHS